MVVLFIYQLPLVMLLNRKYFTDKEGCRPYEKPRENFKLTARHILFQSDTTGFRRKAEERGGRSCGLEGDDHFCFFRQYVVIAINDFFQVQMHQSTYIHKKSLQQ